MPEKKFGKSMFSRSSCSKNKHSDANISNKYHDKTSIVIHTPMAVIPKPPLHLRCNLTPQVSFISDVILFHR